MRKLFLNSWVRVIGGIGWLALLGSASAWVFCRLSLISASAQLGSNSQSTPLTKAQEATLLNFLHLSAVDMPTVVEFFDFQCPHCLLTLL